MQMIGQRMFMQALLLLVVAVTTGRTEFTGLPVTVPGASPGVTRLIHQSWQNSSVPDRFKDWQQSWKQSNPGWEYKLWTDEDNLALVTEHYPWYAAPYQTFHHKIMRCDFVRYLYMYHYGGVYADLDMECLRPMDGLLRDMHAAVGQMGHNTSFSHSIPNAFMASEPKHPFWLFCLNTVMMRYMGPYIRNATYNLYAPEHVTGPVALRQSLVMYMANAPNSPPITVLAPGVIYPVDWASAKSNAWLKACIARGTVTFNHTACKESVLAKFPEAAALTYWTHSWGD